MKIFIRTHVSNLRKLKMSLPPHRGVKVNFEEDNSVARGSCLVRGIKGAVSVDLVLPIVRTIQSLQTGLTDTIPELEKRIATVIAKDKAIAEACSVKASVEPKPLEVKPELIADSKPLPDYKLEHILDAELKPTETETDAETWDETHTPQNVVIDTMESALKEMAAMGIGVKSGRCTTEDLSKALGVSVDAMGYDLLQVHHGELEGYWLHSEDAWLSITEEMHAAVIRMAQRTFKETDSDRMRKAHSDYLAKALPLITALVNMDIKPEQGGYPESMGNMLYTLNYYTSGTEEITPRAWSKLGQFTQSLYYVRVIDREAFNNVCA